jgi:arylsulfatase A-like enzyme
MAERPNVIFVMADDLGYGDLGCYGQQTIATPHLDQMAAEGMRFTDCYAGSTVCAPSRCVLMTGLHTGHCYIRGNAGQQGERVPLRSEDVTVAEVMKSAGYATGIVGKWGLGEPDTTGIPNRQGFDYWFGYLNQGRAHNYYPEYLWRNEEKVPLEGNVEEQRNVATQREQYTHDLFTEDALQFIDRHQDEPFFLYLAYTIPHANNERGRALGDGMEVPDYGSYGNRDWPDPEKGKAAMIERLDRDMGRLFDKLKEAGIDESTVVFFTSDNGPHREGGVDPTVVNSSGPLRGIKRDLYEGGIRVPTIARWPGRIETGSVSDHPWAFWDVLPTCADLGGAATPSGLDGISVVPELLGRSDEQPKHDALYWEFHERVFKQAVRVGDWKAVRNGYDNPVELYDLAQDLGEKNDLAKQHPDIVARMTQYIEEGRTHSEFWPGKRS